MLFGFASAAPRRIFAARRIGGRRFRLAKKHCAFLGKRKSSKMFGRTVRFGLRCFSFPMTCLFALTRRAASLGEQAMKGLTPACRGCNAGDGPCAPNDFVHANDAWAKYLHQKSKQVPRNSSAKRPAPVVDRARWIDCKVDMSQFEDSLSQLLPDQFQSSATGVAMLSRPLFLEASSVRRKIYLHKG